MATQNVSDFSTDLIFGKEGEKLVEEILTGGYSVEVKTDRQWAKTGNLYIETDCYYQARRAWGPSGITTTQANYWAFVLAPQNPNALPAIHFYHVDVVRYAIEEFGSLIECKIPPNPSKGVLVTLAHLDKAVKEYRNGN
jgi:hypothetical protein